VSWHKTLTPLIVAPNGNIATGPFYLWLEDRRDDNPLFCVKTKHDALLLLLGLYFCFNVKYPADITRTLTVIEHVLLPKAFSDSKDVRHIITKIKLSGYDLKKKG